MNDDDAMDMDIDPTLSLNAAGLWSDEESNHDPISDVSDPELVPTIKRKAGRRKKHEKSPPPQIKKLLAQSTSLFAGGDPSGAKACIHEIITMDNECVPAYTLLSHIYEDQGMKTEAVNALVSAAMNSPKDPVVWIRAARMSRDLGFWQQALKCYDTGVKLEPDDIDVLYERSVLHAEHGSVKKATDGFLTLLRVIPMDMTVTRDLAKLYNSHGRNQDATALYEGTRTHYMKLPEEPMPNGDLKTPFDWNELNIYLGLLSTSSQPKLSIDVIHSTSRWLHGRRSETFWDIQSDSREWDEDDTRRSQVPEYDPTKWDISRFTLPIEIRVRLGINWVQAQNLPEAMIQFQFLERENVETYSDLFWDAAEALQNHGYSNEALHFYTTLNDHEQYNVPITWAAMGRCYEALNESQQAEECFLMCATENPADFDSRLRLAEIYEATNRKDEALAIVEAVIRDREHYKATTVPDVVDTSGALIPNVPRNTSTNTSAAPPKPRKILVNHRAEMEALQRHHCLSQWQKLEALKEGMENGAQEDVQTWMAVANGLTVEFRKEKLFFPYEKGKRITWYDDEPPPPKPVKEVKKEGRRRKKPKFESSIESRVEELQQRLQETLESPSPSPEPEADRDSETERMIIETKDLSQEVFRGLKFEQWFYIFIQSAILLIKRDANDDAEEILGTVFDANVFFQNSRFMTILNTLRLANGMRRRSLVDISMILRWFMQTYQFRSDPYRLYYLAIGTGMANSNQFHLQVDQKSLLRHIKAIDGLITGENMRGSASIKDVYPDIPKCIPTRQNAVLLILYGHRLAAGDSFAPAQMYYFRARELGVRDPLLELSIGIAYLHRAMQRQADNRHVLILQGMTFVFQYYRSYYERSYAYPGKEGVAMRQQAEFNVGRAFHQLGLLTFALQYYEKVIKMSDEMGGLGGRDLLFEGVHNLGLIYGMAGNMAALKELTEKYLVL